MEQTTTAYAPEDIQATKGLAWLSYLGIFFLIPMLSNKDSGYTKFHVNQGIVLLIVEIVYGVVAAILNAIAGALIFVSVGLAAILAIVFNLIIAAIGVALFVFAIMGIVNAAQGNAKELPIIGKIRILK